jgi:hypothetical protein
MVGISEFTSRACRAWFKSGSNVDQPSNDSGEVSIAGKNYVVLRNVRGIMAVYRMRNDGALKRLKRWPEGLN